MNADAVLKTVEVALRVLALAVQAGTSVPEILADIEKIKSWANGSVVPTSVDHEALLKREDELLAIINDTSRDDV
jgi:hypothetical protein